MHKIYIAIDNGTSGSIGWVGDCTSGYVLTPTFKEQSYTKAKKIISRIDRKALRDLLLGIQGDLPAESIFVILERPRVNPGQFMTTVSAVRSLEATLGVIEDLGYARMYVDSRDWQSVMLPKGTKGSPELKKASLDIGCRLFPQFSDLIIKHKDADGILMAEWARRSQL